MKLPSHLGGMVSSPAGWRDSMGSIKKLKFKRVKKIIQILAIVGTGMVIGSLAGRILKIEGRQMNKALKDLVGKSKLEPGSTMGKKQDELEFYFI